jgi:ComF family protein
VTRSASKWATGIYDALIAVLLAPVCAACSVPLGAPTRGAVCDSCWRQISPLTPPICDCCGDTLPSWRVVSLSEGRCPRCRRGSTAVRRRRSVGVYDGSLRHIVHALKYGGRRSIARHLGTLMREQGSEVLNGAEVVVPVPLHPLRQLSRGFNQADDLAQFLGLPVASALRRTRNTGSQADLPAASRHANVRGAFAVVRATDVRDKCVVLVDDVSTTGATLDACGRALLESGAREVRAVIAARAVSPGR